MIDGNGDLVERDRHREAIFWMAATDSRCQKVLYHDAPAVMNCFSEGYRLLLNDRGITSVSDLRRRNEQVGEQLPDAWKVAEAIIAANRDIEN